MRTTPRDEAETRQLPKTCDEPRLSYTAPVTPKKIPNIHSVVVEYSRVPASFRIVWTFQAIDARLRKAFRWLEKAITYLDELKPPIDHRFDLGHGLVFESPRWS